MTSRMRSRLTFRWSRPTVSSATVAAVPVPAGAIAAGISTRAKSTKTITTFPQLTEAVWFRATKACEQALRQQQLQEDGKEESSGGARLPFNLSDGSFPLLSPPCKPMLHDRRGVLSCLAMTTAAVVAAATAAGEPVGGAAMA